MKYSVIIPVYNAEKTIRRCVDSLLTQDFTDAEIILVNDGSQDGSGTICEEYARTHQNVRYIAQPNGGVAAARNAGLDAAQGEYILFVDSDDYVTQDFFSCIDHVVREEDADWIRFLFCFGRKTTGMEQGSNVVRARSRSELLPYIVDGICRKTLNGPVAKLYRRKLIEDNCLRFPVGASVAEDRAFNIVYSLYIQNYAASRAVVYVVNTDNENSLSRRRHEDLQKQFEITGSFLRSRISAAPVSDGEKELYRQALNFGVCRGIYHDAKMLLQDRVGWFSRQKQLIKLCIQINKRHMKYPRSRYCNRITLPVRLYLTPLIDAMAAVLVRRQNS